ncbi:MAG: glucose-1-phosphate adenylyltransferase [Omnitrophica WOR_2 bacterium RIFCSPHIGHO2_02_FULL_68_15]|nr:MAG: glucose-1-phosphate adenylyltransferase [Omnitrophica WOR_2 bacterium RIFCSPHIGHO2_02_FULL_68_15]
MSSPRILGMVMAGGKGERLVPLTRDRGKPSVPFGGRYRIVDFVLSNLINSGILSIYALVQYRSQSLIEHLRVGWQHTGLLPNQFIAVVPPQMRWQEDVWYRGTADAVSQNLNLIWDFEPDLVAVFGADHIYRMDIAQMVRFHLERKADVTVAALPVPLDRASTFGIIEADREGRIQAFVEKPARPKPILGDPSRAFSSMGNYLFNVDVLTKTLEEDARRSTAHDFGWTILPSLAKKAKLYAYNFLDNQVPGVRSYEEPGYWRDVGTIQSYWQTNMDLLGAKPLFDLSNPLWPIHAAGLDLPGAQLEQSDVDDALLGEGCHLQGATVRHSVFGRGVIVEEGAVVEDSVIMDYTVIRRGARVRNAIVDRFNTIESGQSIGYDPSKDQTVYYVDASGIVVVPRGPRRRYPETPRATA